VPDGEKIFVFKPDGGQPYRTIVHAGHVHTIAVDSEGYLYAAGNVPGSTLLYMISPEQSIPFRIVDLGAYGTVAEIVPDHAGHISLVQQGAKRVLKMDRNGTLLDTIPDLPLPSAAAVDGATLYVACAGTSEVRVFRNGHHQPAAIIRDGIASPTGLAIGS